MTCLSQYRLQQETGVKDGKAQAEWFRLHYGLNVKPAANGKLYLDKEIWYRVRLGQPVEDEPILNFDA